MIIDIVMFGQPEHIPLDDFKKVRIHSWISTRFAHLSPVFSYFLRAGLWGRVCACVLHFTVDGRDVEDYSIRFLVGKKVYTATAR
ncbi:MAG: hypothetical protein R2682_07290 [Pyrinomonadaceae bacterium]